jgi:2-deoxy-D-gluconate 3-dehydrogenase
MTLFDLQKRVAFITGGNGGIGLGIAKGFASSGAAVVIAGRNETKAQAALSELHSLGAQAEFVALDVLLSGLAVSMFLSTMPEQAFARHRKT